MLMHLDIYMGGGGHGNGTCWQYFPLSLALFLDEYKYMDVMREYMLLFVCKGMTAISVRLVCLGDIFLQGCLPVYV